MAMNPSHTRGALPLDPTSIVAIITLIAGVVFATRSFKSPRNGQSDGDLHLPIGLQKIDLPILEDPFDAIDIALDQSNKVTSLDSLTCALSNFTNLEMILCVIPGGTSTEDHESRLRARHAVVAGLTEAGFAPVDHSRIGVVCIPHNLECDDDCLSCTCCLDDTPNYFAFEQFKKDNGPDNVGPRLLVWVNDDQLRQSYPNLFLSRTINNLVGGCDNQTKRPTTHLIGPYSSDVLKLMLKDNHRIWPNNDQGLTLVALPSASADALGIKRDPFEPLSRSLMETTNPCLGSLVDFAATDAALLARLFAEFKERGLDVDNPSKDHLVVVADSTTLVGRSLPDELTKILATRHNDPGPTTLFQRRRPSGPTNLHVFTYLAPIDGGRTNASGVDGPNPTRSHFFRSSRYNPLGVTGPHQMDSLSALAEQIAETDRKLRIAEGGSIKGVIVGGGDINDTLTVLQALRPALPNAIFATTELDARLWEPRNWPHTHNMIVASAYGIQLHPEIQGRTRPFRDSRQTALFAATLFACGDKAIQTFVEPNSMAKQGLRAPKKSSRLFEIGRIGPVPLDPPSALASISLGFESLHPTISNPASDNEWRIFLLPALLLVLLVVVILSSLMPGLRSLTFSRFEFQAQPLWIRHDDIGGVRGIWLLRNITPKEGPGDPGPAKPGAPSFQYTALTPEAIKRTLSDIIHKRRGTQADWETICRKKGERSPSNDAGSGEKGKAGPAGSASPKDSEAGFQADVDLSQTDIIDVRRFLKRCGLKRVKEFEQLCEKHLPKREGEETKPDAKTKSGGTTAESTTNPQSPDDWREPATRWLEMIYYALSALQRPSDNKQTKSTGSLDPWDFYKALVDAMGKPWSQIRSTTLLDNWNQDACDRNRWILARLVFQEIFEGTVRPWNHYATLESEADDIIAEINSRILRGLDDPDRGTRTVSDQGSLKILVQNRELLDSHLRELVDRFVRDHPAPPTQVAADAKQGIPNKDGHRCGCGDQPTTHEETGSRSILTSSNDARAAATELFAIRKRRVWSFIFLLSLGFLVCLTFTFGIIGELFRTNGGMLSGTSIIPTLFGLCGVIILAGMFLARSLLGLSEMRSQATRYFRISKGGFETEAERSTRTWWGEVVAYFKEIMFPVVPEHQSPVMANRLWQEYMTKSSTGARVVRITSLLLIYSVATWVLLYLSGHGEIDLPLIRGREWKWAHLILSNLAVTAFLFMAFWTIDAAMLCSWFLRCLTQGPTVYPKATYKMVQDMRGRVDDRIIADYIDIKLIDRITRGIGPLLYFPGILLALLVCSYNTITYPWAWPTSWSIIMGCHFLIAVVSILSLQASAESARRQTLEALDRHLKQFESDQTPSAEAQRDVGLAHARDMISEVRTLEGGVFVGIWRNPAIGATLLPILAGLLMAILRWWIEEGGI